MILGAAFVYIYLAQTYKVASTPTGIGLVLMQRLRLILGQCDTYFWESVIPIFGTVCRSLLVIISP